MRRLLQAFAVLAVLGLLASVAWAAGDDAKPAPAPRPWAPMTVNFGPCGSGMPPGLLAVGGNFLYGESDGMRHYDSKLNDSVTSTKNMEVIKTRYSFMPGTDVRTATPIYSVHLDRSPASDFTSYGVGDTTILFHTVLLNQDQGAPLYLAVDYGGIVPTASVGNYSNNAIGNDAWGLMGGVGITYFLESHRFDMEVNYATFSEGAKNFKKGDRIRWNTGYAYAINKMWDVGVESYFEWDDQTELSGTRQKDTCYEWYAGPKAVWKYQPWGVNIGVAGMLPVNRWYQANKAASDDYRFELKIMKFFDIGTLFN